MPCEVRLSGAVEQTLTCGIEAARTRGRGTFILKAQIGDDAKKMPMVAITATVRGDLHPSTTYTTENTKTIFGVVLDGDVKYLAQADDGFGDVQFVIDELGAEREGPLLLYDVHGTVRGTFKRADDKPGTIELTATF